MRRSIEQRIVNTLSTLIWRPRPSYAAPRVNVVHHRATMSRRTRALSSVASMHNSTPTSPSFRVSRALGAHWCAAARRRRPRLSMNIQRDTPAAGRSQSEAGEARRRSAMRDGRARERMSRMETAPKLACRSCTETDRDRRRCIVTASSNVHSCCRPRRLVRQRRERLCDAARHATPPRC